VPWLLKTGCWALPGAPKPPLRLIWAFWHAPLCHLAQAIGFKRDKAEEVFDSIDEDGSNEINKDEFMAFFLSGKNEELFRKLRYAGIKTKIPKNVPVMKTGCAGPARASASALALQEVGASEHSWHQQMNNLNRLAMHCARAWLVPAKCNVARCPSVAIDCAIILWHVRLDRLNMVHLLVLMCEASRMTSAHWQIWDQYDEDRDGWLTEDQLYKALRSVGIRLRKIEKHELRRELEDELWVVASANFVQSWSAWVLACVRAHVCLQQESESLRTHAS
jgi:Ca2+-binding EF-hand superfamily protein